MDRNDFLEFIKVNNKSNYKTKPSYLYKNQKDFVADINNYCNSYDIVFSDFSEMLWFYVYELKERPMCIVCKKPLPINKRQNLYCSVGCVKLDRQNITKRRQQTCLDRYGSKGPLSKPGANDKKKATCLLRFGVEHATQNKEIIESIKQNNLQKYGVDNVSKIPDVAQKISKSISQAYKDHGEDIIEKRKQTNFDIHGEYVINTKQSIENTKQTLVLKYNTYSPFKINDDTYQKAKDGSILFYSDVINKNNAINKREQTNLVLYGGDPNLNIVIKKQRNLTTTKRFLEKYKIVDEIKSYENSIYKCECNNGHHYEISRDMMNRRAAAGVTLCTTCYSVYNHGTSIEEEYIFEWIKSYFPDAQKNVRNLVDRYELDIYIPSKKFAIEYNGIYWHSDLHRPSNYHQKKLLAFKESDINIFTIWEDLWLTKPDIYKSIILNKLGCVENRIYARTTIFSTIENRDTVNDFLNENHIQGASNYSHAYGLIHNNELLSLITIGKRSIKRGVADVEIIRFCHRKNTNILGGFSKLFKNIKKIHGDISFKSYHNLDFGYSSFYEKVGFKNVGITQPNYYYIIKGNRHHRYNFRKDRLVKMGFDQNMTEFEIMDANFNFLRIYDNGSLIYTI